MMNSMQRTLTAIGHKEPDRVPLFLLLSFYGAKELGMSIREYFSKPEYVLEGQLRMRKKYSNDCIYTFFHAPVEIEAFGGEILFVEDGPPNSAEPFIKSVEQIRHVEVPNVYDSRPLRKVLEATSLLKEAVGDEVPIIGVVMSPFSLPVMQLGFDKYLELIYFRPVEFEQLIKINEEFCVAWANAQLQAGATAICYFDPLASPAMIEREKYLETGHKIASRTISRIKGPTATHLASGITIPVLDDIVATGTAVLGFSNRDDVDEIKRLAQNKICLLGNLNGVEMATWDRKKAREETRKLIKGAAKGGGFILSDNHGEIPWQVSEDVLMEIAQTVEEYGTYPIKAD